MTLGFSDIGQDKVQRRAFGETVMSLAHPQ
jgi:hypothetical protein